MIETFQTQRFTCDVCKKSYPYFKKSVGKLEISVDDSHLRTYQVCDSCAGLFFIIADNISKGKINVEDFSNDVLCKCGYT